LAFFAGLLAQVAVCVNPRLSLAFFGTLTQFWCLVSLIPRAKLRLLDDDRRQNRRKRMISGAEESSDKFLSYPYKFQGDHELELFVPVLFSIYKCTNTAAHWNQHKRQPEGTARDIDTASCLDTFHELN
jgi:hypothetical protein